MKYFNPTFREYTAPMDLTVFQNTVNTLEQRHQDAVEASSKLAQSIAALDMHSSEDAFKSELNSRVQATIDANTFYGYKGAAIDDIMEASNDILFGAATTGRLRTNQDYKAGMAEIDATNTTKGIKAMFKELNPYHYEDTYDENGKIIGGSKWELNTKPVDTVNLSTIITNGIQIAAKESGGSTQTQWLDVNGKVTTNPNEAFDGNYYNSTSGKWERLSREKILQGIQAFIETTPGAKESLAQDYMYAQYKYDKEKAALNDPTKLLISDITDENGNLLNESQYLMKRIAPAVQAASYYNYTSQTTYGEGLKTYMAAQRAAQAAAGGLGGGLSDTVRGRMSTTGRNSVIELKGKPTIDYASDQSNAFADLQDAFKKITGKDLALASSAHGKNITIEGLISKHNISPEQANELRGIVRRYNRATENLNTIYGAMTKEERDIAMFNDRVMSGAPLLAVKNGGTKYDEELIKLQNELRANNTHSVCFSMEPEMRSRFEHILNKNENNALTKLGLKFNERNQLIIPIERINMIPLISKTVARAERIANHGFFTTIRQGIGAALGYESNQYLVSCLDANGKDVYDADFNVNEFDTNKWHTNAGRSSWIHDEGNKIIDKMADIVNNANDDAIKIRDNYGIRPENIYLSMINYEGENFNQAELFDRYSKGLISKEEYNMYDKFYSSSFMSSTISNGNFGQAQVYINGDVDGTEFERYEDDIIRAASSNEALDAQAILLTALKDNRLSWSPTIVPGTYDRNGNQTYGYSFTIAPKGDKEGNPVGEPMKIVVTGIGQESAADAIMRDPAIQSKCTVALLGANKETKVMVNGTDYPGIGTVTIGGIDNEFFKVKMFGSEATVDFKDAADLATNLEYYQTLVDTFKMNGGQMDIRLKQGVDKVLNDLSNITGVSFEVLGARMSEDITNGY